VTGFRECPEGGERLATDGGNRELPEHMARYAVYTQDRSDGSIRLGIRQSESEQLEATGLKIHGYGSDLKSPAFDELRDRLDLDAFEPHEYVGTITIDVEEWVYAVELAEGVEER